MEYIIRVFENTLALLHNKPGERWSWVVMDSLGSKIQYGHAFTEEIAHEVAKLTADHHTKRILGINDYHYSSPIPVRSLNYETVVSPGLANVDTANGEGA